jgi:hypothetical protein
MKNRLFFALLAFSPLAVSGEYLAEEELKAQFCNKTFHGTNLKSRATFNIHVNESCDRQTVYYLTGKKTGETITLALKLYSNGDYCIVKGGKERCGRVKAIGGGNYHKISSKSGRHTHLYKDFVDGDQL